MKKHMDGRFGIAGVLLMLVFLYGAKTLLPAQTNGKQDRQARLITDEKYMPNYSGSPKSVQVEKKSKTHFRIHFPDGGRSEVGWFLFRAEGLTPGKTYRFDLINVPDKWRTLNPVFSAPGVKNLRNPKYFDSKPVRQPEQLYKSPNGARIPNTDGQSWNYMRSVEWEGSSNTLVCKQKFRGKQSWIAMRVPMTLEYREAFYRKIEEQNKPYVKIHKVGESEEGNPLKIVEIGEMTENARRNRPTVVWWLQEHCDEHDASWLGDGVIRYFSGNSEQARRLRKRINLLVVMLADPDGTIRSQYKNNLHTFIEGNSSKMSRAYSGWFREEWLDKNRTLTCVNTIHNVENNEMSVHLANASVETRKGRFNELIRLHGDIVSYVQQQDFKVKKKPWKRAYRNDRLGGFLRRHTQSAHLFYETNSQMPGRHLTLHDLRMLGVHMTKAIIKHLYSKRAKPLLKTIKLKRKKRRWLVKRYGILEKEWKNNRLIPHEIERLTPFSIESMLWDMPGWERGLYLKNALTTNRNDIIEKLYSQKGVSYENLKVLESIRLSSSTSQGD